MAWHHNGWLYASDSNNRRLYAIPPGGGSPKLVIGPAGSGALFSDQDLFAQPEAGFAPNGLVFSPDFPHESVIKKIGNINRVDHE
jgi:sugar lactone lactonase YvrE